MKELLATVLSTITLGLYDKTVAFINTKWSTYLKARHERTVDKAISNNDVGLTTDIVRDIIAKRRSRRDGS